MNYKEIIKFNSNNKKNIHKKIKFRIKLQHLRKIPLNNNNQIVIINN